MKFYNHFDIEISKNQLDQFKSSEFLEIHVDPYYNDLTMNAGVLMLVHNYDLKNRFTGKTHLILDDFAIERLERTQYLEFTFIAPLAENNQLIGTIRLKN